jgi:dihydrofolate synthase/folylpolyglutamate synthase
MFQRVGDQAFKKDLSNTLELLNTLGNPHKLIKSIHIAGSNGKGSVTHIMASILQAEGYKVACYTSPHYKDFRERIKINGEFVSEAYVISFVERIKEAIERIKPSFFEITVAMAFDYFAQQNIDVAIIETGMGGRFDSTNVLTPLLSIITNISFDHQQFLGDTLSKIAFEKAGIIKKQIPVLIGEEQSSISKVFLDKAMDMESALFHASEIFEIAEFKSSIKGIDFTHFYGKRKLHFHSDITGSFQKKNIQTALAAIILIREEFPVSEQSRLKGLEQIRTSTKFIGRCMQLHQHPLVIVDSAHNEAGLKELNQIIAEVDYDKLHFVYGTVSDKDLSKVLPLLHKTASYYFCKANIPRGMNAEQLKLQAAKYNLKGAFYPTVAIAYQEALKAASTDDLIVVSGSIFVVAEVL